MSGLLPISCPPGKLTAVHRSGGRFPVSPFGEEIGFALKVCLMVRKRRLWIMWRLLRMSKMFKTLTAPYGRRPESASKLSRDRRERSFGLLLCAVLVPCTIMAQQPLYKNPNAPMEQRADDLLSRMSIEEK